MRNKYQRKERKSNHKFEIVRGQELLVRVPLPKDGSGTIHAEGTIPATLEPNVKPGS